MSEPTYELGDWFSNNIPNWELWLGDLRGKPVKALEVGTCEGRSARWLLEHVLTHEDSTLVCVDPAFQRTCYPNLRPWKKRVYFADRTSREYWQEEFNDAKDFALIYIDGSHHARDVLEDAVFGWQFLLPGGILIFDDYLYGPAHDPTATEWDRPGPPIDAFLSAYRRELEVLEDAPNAINPGWQKAVRKRR